MEKLKKAVKAIIAIIKNPWLLNIVLSNDAVWDNYLIKHYDLRHGLPVLEINDICPNFSETLDCFAFLDGGSLPTDIALLKALSRKFDGCKYFEIGTWRGESVVNVAETAAECHTLNLSEAELLSLGFEEQYANLHGFFSKGKENITHLIGNSMNYDFAALQQKFDLIFIDGNHNFEFVKNDTEKIFEHLTHDDSIIVWHDYAYNPEKLRPEVLSAILDGTPAHLRKHLYHVSNTMCAVFCKGDFSTTTLSAPSTPSKIFKLTVEHSV